MSVVHQDLESAYRRDGVVTVKGILRRAEIEEIRERLARYERDRLESIPRADVTFEADGATVRNLWRLDRHEPFFASLATRGDFLDLVGPLVAGEAVPLGVETFNKPAVVGSQVPWHQDNAYFCQRPADVLTLWIALDAVTPENGPVEYLLCSHGELLPHAPSGVEGNSYGLARPPDAGAFATFSAILEPGDATIHHGEIIHRSAPNRSGRSRLALIIPYRGSHTRTDPDLLAAYERARRRTMRER